MISTCNLIEEEHVGYNGVEESDIGRWLVHSGSVTYFRDTEHEARALTEYLNAHAH